MLRRSVLELSSRRSLIKRIPREIAYQRIPSCPHFCKEFSTAFPKSGDGGKPPGSQSSLPKVFLGSAVIAGAALLAYQSGYLDQYIGKEQQGPLNSAEVGIAHKDVKETQNSGEQVATSISEDLKSLSQDVDQTSDKVERQNTEVEQKAETRIDLSRVETQQNTETQVDLPHSKTEQKAEASLDIPQVKDEKKVKAEKDIAHIESLSKAQAENQSHIQEKPNVTTNGEAISIQEKQQEDVSSITGLDSKNDRELNDEVQPTEVQTQTKVVPEETESRNVPPPDITAEDRLEAAVGKSLEAANLIHAYQLEEKAEERTASDGLGEQAFAGAIEDLNGSYITKDGKLVLDFLQAIHEAEKRQADLDIRAFTEEKRALKEKYEKELRDLRARELMRTEETAMLDKEIKRERAKAAAAIRTLQEKMEEKLRMELEEKENETELRLKKLQELAKAELTAAITKEKATQIEKMAEANLNINALCMAFYARSEEARQIHSVHKLALGALALEDALSKGFPIQKELDALNTYLEGIDKDSLLHLVLSTLPEETRHHGTDTLLQLNQKFNSLKGALRHYILIPPGGGGSILVHSLAQIASWLRIKEVDPSGDGIESVISRVESFLAEGKLAEAADALQEGVRGSKAEEMAGDWVTRARNRAITEQALTVLQSYATCLGLTQ